MAKPEWGTKRLCPSCGARFYDMKKNPAVCPGCNADVPIEPLSKPRKAAPVKEAPAPVKEEVKAKADPASDDESEGDIIDAVIDDVEDIDDDDEDDDDALIEDASDLEEDEDIPEIAEHMEEDLNADG